MRSLTCDHKIHAFVLGKGWSSADETRDAIFSCSFSDVKDSAFRIITLDRSAPRTCEENSAKNRVTFSMATTEIHGEIFVI